MKSDSEKHNWLLTKLLNKKMLKHEKRTIDRGMKEMRGSRASEKTVHRVSYR